MGLETKVLSFSRSKRKQNEQKCQKINSSIFLVLNQVRNQENKTDSTLICKMEFQPFLDSSFIMLLFLCSYYSSFIMLHKTAEKKKKFLYVDFFY